MPKIEMNLSDYLRVVRKRKLIIILCFILVVASTVYYTLKQTRIYQTSCRVKIEQRKSVAQILTELITWSPGDEMVSQANLIKSYQIIEKVAERLNLLNADMTAADRMAEIKGLQKQVETENIEATNMIAITVISSNPKEAMTIANTLAHVYVEAHFENKKKEAYNVKKFVEAQLDDYSKGLQESENELQKFRQENPLVTERDIKSVPIIQTDPRVLSFKEEIVKLELELISLKSKYTDDHPDVIALNQNLAKAKRDLSDTLSQLMTQQKELSAKEIQLAQLKRNVTIADEMYMMFKKRYAEARILEAEKAQDVTIVEPASMPSRPIKPDINFNVIIGIFSGLLIGLAMAFAVEQFDTSIGRIDDIEELIKLPVLGLIPHVSSEKGKRKIKIKSKRKKETSEEGLQSSRLAVLFDPTSVLAESYRALRTHLDYAGVKGKGKSMVITSASPGEGKTQTLVNLASAFAQDGKKALIVGSDFRKPTIYEIFGIKRSPGLSDVLIGKISLKKAINTFTDMILGSFDYDQALKVKGLENLNIITCGEYTPNPAELVNSPQMSDLIQELTQEFDIVLLDSPPVLPVTDSSILGKKTDGVVLVYQAGKTPRQALIRAKMQLDNVSAKIWGVVINSVKADYIQDISLYHRYQYYSHKKE